jgi:hypothetical protein
MLDNALLPRKLEQTEIIKGFITFTLLEILLG